MKLSARALRLQAGQFIKDRQHLAAMRAFLALIGHRPEDYDARLGLADALAGAGARDQAIEVYRATATLCISGGRPLVALVACRALEALGQSPDGLIERLADLYGRGSDRLSVQGGRLTLGKDDLEVDVRELRRQCTVTELVREAVTVGSDLERVSGLPLKLVPIPVLSELRPQTLARVLREIIVQRLPAGREVIRQGEPGQSCFFVARGKVRVLDARQQELALLGDGALFGEMSMITGQPRSATVRVEQETDLIELGPAALAALGDELSRVAPALDSLAQKRWMANLLRQSPLMRVLSESERLELLRRFKALEVARGTVLFDQGVDPQGVYLVARGEVELKYKSEQLVLSRLGAGATLGLHSVLRGAPMPATATTLAPSTVLFLHSDQVRRLAAAIPELTAEARDGTALGNVAA